MRLRTYKLQTYGKLDAILLEDKLHNYVHAENILEDDEKGIVVSRQLSPGDAPAASDSRSLVPKTSSNGLYGILRLNEFDIEDKRIRRKRLFVKRFCFFGERFPTHEVQLLLSGEEPPLIAIHDFLVQDQHYLVLSAKDVEYANWFAKTDGAMNSFVRDYTEELEKYIEKNFGNTLQRQFTFIEQGSGYYSSEISVRGRIENVLKLRKQLRTGFKGLKIEEDEISYS